MVIMTNELEQNIKDKVVALLETPYVGTKMFRTNHPQARYCSNCHGTMSYVFSLNCKGHPIFLSSEEMHETIQERFTREKQIKPGDLVAFYQTETRGLKNPSLFHTSLCVGNKTEIFHQTGTAGVFEIVPYEQKLTSLRTLLGDGIEIVGFRLI